MKRKLSAYGGQPTSITRESILDILHVCISIGICTIISSKRVSPLSSYTGQVAGILPKFGIAWQKDVKRNKKKDKRTIER